MAPESESLIIHDFYDGRLAEAHVAGKLEKADYRALAPELRRLIRRRGKIRMLLQLHHFQGWHASARWHDLPPSEWPPFSKIERLAIVTQRRWEPGHLSFTRPFIHAWTKFFPTEKGADARAWIDGGLNG